MLVPRNEDAAEAAKNDQPVIIQITVVIDSNDTHKAFLATEILSRACVGLALDGITTDINMFKPDVYDAVDVNDVDD